MKMLLCKQQNDMSIVIYFDTGCYHLVVTFFQLCALCMPIDFEIFMFYFSSLIFLHILFAVLFVVVGTWTGMERETGHQEFLADYCCEHLVWVLPLGYIEPP